MQWTYAWYLCELHACTYFSKFKKKSTPIEQQILKLTECYFHVRHRVIWETGTFCMDNGYTYEPIFISYVTSLIPQWMWIWMTNERAITGKIYNKLKRIHLFGFVKIDGHANGNFITCWPMQTILSSIRCDYKEILCKNFFVGIFFPSLQITNQINHFFYIQTKIFFTVICIAYLRVLILLLRFSDENYLITVQLLYLKTQLYAICEQKCYI